MIETEERIVSVKQGQLGKGKSKSKMNANEGRNVFSVQRGKKREIEENEV